jgi:DNA processing protein
MTELRHTRACRDCLRSSWLLHALSGYLEGFTRDYQRLVGLLELEGDELIAAVGAAGSQALRGRYQSFETQWIPQRRGVSAICRHDSGYPPVLAGLVGAPAVLYLAAPLERLMSMFAEPAVAIVGSRKATSYGVEVAHSLARDLAGAGVTIVSGLGDGIAGAAHAGALDGSGSILSVMPGGVDICYPAPKRALYERLLEVGCAVSELPCNTPVRRWCYPARNRLIAALATLTVVVECEDSYGAKMPSILALAVGRDVGAVPGPITSLQSRGAHALLADGAYLVRHAQDVLDLLYGAGARTASSSVPELDCELREVLERIGSGQDTVSKLSRDGTRHNDVLVALAELEVRGRVRRLGGGRYVACPS